LLAGFPGYPRAQVPPRQCIQQSSIGVVNGPGLWRFDFSLVKGTQIMERVNMQFRVDAFNLFNHTNYSTINTTITSSLFGHLRTTKDGGDEDIAPVFWSDNYISLLPASCSSATIRVAASRWTRERSFCRKVQASA